ncbi:hypothetical protein HID58_056756 [Brassica napus]|uniref:BnaC03g76970D protein n=3 Tax=Brassica TaxID=3705 RepID=A0A078JBE9_BRANA|nr:vesicle-associated protein 1-4-like [Brassica napus]KAH0894327.1 hypothetical protein HID58_056756 [Brassica napus]CAF1710801.1 unnamed protein product [Brassica napus]CDY63405.1 BnaC03g76970D [Brassica napus]VDC99421.1 unnamed protein product [Brassica oleracea]
MAAQPQPAISDYMVALVEVLSPFMFPPRPQVFVNFRGKELRNGFVSHVVKALKDVRINVFIDSLERRGVETLEHLLKRIDESEMALAIFSDRYTESEWCLDELVRMYDRMKEGKLVVIPVFYRVSTDDVKNFRGEFGRQFTNTVRRKFGTIEAPSAQRWMIAVTSIASMTGLTSEVHSIDSKLVEKIVEASKRQLGHFSSACLTIYAEVSVECLVALAVFMVRCYMNPKMKLGDPGLFNFTNFLLYFVIRKSLLWCMS